MREHDSKPTRKLASGSQKPVRFSRRSFLAATAFALPAVPALAVTAQANEPAAPRPVTWNVLTRYYAFLRKEMMLLVKEMGVDPNDPWIVEATGDREAMEWLAGDTPSSRAHTVLDVIAAPPTVPPLDRGDMLLPILREAVGYEKHSDHELGHEEQARRLLSLECWSGPAPTLESALLALEFVRREVADLPRSPASESMLAASEKYFRWVDGHG